jgi:predicted nucleic acid-binding protein
MLVDTSVWIDYFNGYRSPETDYLADAIDAALPIIIPGIVLTEILLGLRNEAEAARIANLLSAFDPAPNPERKDYIEAATIYRQCRRQGFTIRSTVDCLIAQICLRNNYPLLTKDRDFKAIARCRRLNIVATNE